MSKLGAKHGPFFCKCCTKEFRPSHSTAATYCSNKCQHQHQFDARFDAWIAGKEETSPRWLRQALVEKDGQKCSICGLTDWMKQPITLELDHEDGDYKNNRIENLRMICPNCHSQTMTYKNRNNGRGRPWRRKTSGN